MHFILYVCSRFFPCHVEAFHSLTHCVARLLKSARSEMKYESFSKEHMSVWCSVFSLSSHLHNVLADGSRNPYHFILIGFFAIILH